MGQMPLHEQKRVENFLRSVRRWAIPVLIKLLAEAQDRVIRKTLLAVLRTDGGIPWVHLESLLEDGRWYVVRNAVQLAVDSRCPELTSHFERLLRHPDARVRREVLRGLDAFGADVALKYLPRALVDADASVRIMAARSLGRAGGPQHEPCLLARVDDRNLSNLSTEEIEALLVALATLASDRAVPVLNRLWRRRRLGGRPMAIRLAALQALGTIPSAGSQAALIEASKSGEPQVRRAASQLLHRMPSGPPGGGTLGSGE